MAANLPEGAPVLEEGVTEAAPPQLDLVPRDLEFVAKAVEGDAWPRWGEQFENLDDLRAKIEARLAPGERVRRLAIAAYSADHTSGFMAFDSFPGRERIDGMSHTPVKPEVAAKLEALKPLLAADAMIELRVAGIGQGDQGLKALTAVAEILDVPVRGPIDKAATLMPSRGLIGRWLTVNPRSRGGASVINGWVEQCGAETRPAAVLYVPIPGADRPAAPPAAAEGLVFATTAAAGWAPGAEVVSGVSDLVAKAIASVRLDPISRMSFVSIGSTLYDGFVAFDALEAETVDGGIREQPEYPHLQVMDAHVRAELARLRPYLAHDAEVEFRVARLGSGDAGRRALDKLHEVLGVTVRAPAVSIGELRATGGLATRWRSVGADGLLEWRWTAEPAAGPPPLDPAAFAPIKGVTPPLGRRPEAPAPEVAPALPGPASSVPPEKEPGPLVVLCAGCGRELDEPPATPTRARLPCPACGSLARRREPARSKPVKPGLRGRVRNLLG